ncbi:MAG: AzlC family ABC transporter permease [Desulfobacteraceae bacterium]|jgi:4-azaleucine resistance transporter AzlC
MNLSAETINKSENKYIKEGFKAVWPICVGYVPLGIAMGVLGQKAMLSPLQVLSMSLFVFAGSGQFIAVSMISAGAHSLSIIMTVFMINLRHLLMSSSLCVYMKNVSPKKLTMLSYGIVDETFAVNIEKLKKGEWGPRRSIAVNFFAYSAWALSTFTGCYFGEFIPEGSFGIDYALTAMFICLLVFQLNGSIYFITAVISGLVAVFLAMTLPGNSYIVISSIIAASLGVIIKKRLKKE